MKNNSVQKWLPFEKILDNGIIKLKNNSYIKIIKIIPINFNLKSNLEKEAILNSYKILLKTCNFDIQILIQSNKEDLSKHISKINKNKKSSSKNFYIVIKEFPENKKQKIDENLEKIIFDKLNDKYFNIKECLSRCGNKAQDISDKETCLKVLYSFFNVRKNLLDN